MIIIIVLQAPQSTDNANQTFIYQVCISGSTEKQPFRTVAEKTVRPTNDERIALLREIARGLADPFRQFVGLIPDSAAVKQLDLDDWAFPSNHVAAGTYTLIGDAAHAMTMCECKSILSHSSDTYYPLVLGAGANHAIVDVLELKQMVLSKLGPTATNLRFDLTDYENSMATRTLPSVLASRQACLEAHDWANLTSRSHLLSARQLVIDFDG